MVHTVSITRSTTVSPGSIALAIRATTIMRRWRVTGLSLRCSWPECDYVPLDYAAYADEVQSYLDETEQFARKLNVAVDLAPAHEAAKSWERNGRAALEAARQGSGYWRHDSRRARAQRAMKVERAFLDPEGLAGRPWFKHLIYAPRPTYKALVLPALTEAIEAKDQLRAKIEVERLTRALTRAAAAIE